MIRDGLLSHLGLVWWEDGTPRRIGSIDGYDIVLSMLDGKEEVASPYESILLLYAQSNIERCSIRELEASCLASQIGPVKELYDLKEDIGERTNLYDAFPDVVKQLEELLEQGRNELGDGATVLGRNRVAVAWIICASYVF